MPRESDIESPSDGSGHFKGSETQGQTSGNTVIMVLKEHKFFIVLNQYKSLNVKLPFSDF